MSSAIARCWAARSAGPIRRYVMAADYATAWQTIGMRILALAALAVVVSVAPAFADPHVNKAAGVSIDVPKDWKLGGGGNAMVASDPKEEAAVSLIITDTGDVKKAADALDT